MNDIFLKIHNASFAETTLKRIKEILVDLYGTDNGKSNYDYLFDAAAGYLKSLTPDAVERLGQYDPGSPYDHLKGKVFVISYPDNIYNDEDPTLKTLSEFLKKYFPGINGIHILPERLMSHGDVWPQDFFKVMSASDAVSFVELLKTLKLVDSNRYLTEEYGEFVRKLEEEIIPSWLADRGIEDRDAVVSGIMKVLEGAYNSHFNDGGFSQKTRAVIDPRFGDNGILESITSEFSVMLDYVVNHLDIDNEYLESYRKGLNDGAAFIIVTPEQYEEMKISGEIDKTFRPRPFPLYTGVRKYPRDKYSTAGKRISGMNRIFSESGLPPLDDRVILFFSIFFKVKNDQGLTAEDKRIFSSFCRYLGEKGISEDAVFMKSRLQPGGKMFTPKAALSLGDLAALIGLDREYAGLFNGYDDEIFGEKFFVYTTFSESQVDIYPGSREGFRMIIDDLFHLLSSGNLAMMRMDAIKYLWKERGKINFNMEEGNKLIEVIRLLMELTAPGVLPLDEVNSPDPVVYDMEKDGGFAYLFGQVNATVASFNEENLGPVENFYNLYQASRPDNFVPFVMLSTHDGRSVQGLGVQRTDGHVSIEQFYNLKEIIEDQGGKAKYRSVPPGEIDADTLDKVLGEAGLIPFREEIMKLFDSGDTSKKLRLKDDLRTREYFLKEISRISSLDTDSLSAIPAIDYFLDWIIDGRTVYELCATSRSAFTGHHDGKILSPELEARRFALAQCFVLTFGQAVPAIYMNDLLGLENDYKGYQLSGKPRDLNRHKSGINEFLSSVKTDPFKKEYIPRINRIIELRTSDPSFYPGSRNFEFVSIEDKVFLNHSYHNNSHSIIVGNISGSIRDISFDLYSLKGFTDSDTPDRNTELKFKDLVGEEKVTVTGKYTVKAEIKPYGLIWLRAEK